MDILFPTLNFLYNTYENIRMAFVGIDFQRWNTEFCVSHVAISVQIFLNEIWNHIYFTDDNGNKDFSAILTYGILYISYMKILIKIF